MKEAELFIKGILKPIKIIFSNRRYAFDEGVTFYKLDNGVIYKDSYYKNVHEAVIMFEKDLKEYLAIKI